MQPDTTTPGPAPGAGPAAADVIHDIGYRHYDGPRLGRGYARRSLYSQSLRGAYGFGRSAKSKVMPMILFGVMCLPAVIIVAVAIFTKQNELPVEYTAYAVNLQMVIALYVAAQAPVSVSRDLRFKTVPLYFSRPIDRIDYVTAKFGALATALFALTAVPVLILYVGALLAKLDFTEQTKGFAQGIVSVAVLSLLLAAIGLVIAALTPRRGFGIAAIIAVMFIPYTAVSAVQAIAYDQQNPDAVPWIGLFSPTTLNDTISAAFLGGTPSVPGQVDPSKGVGAIAVLVTVALIAGCIALLLRRYRKAGL
ncbi:ABC transporter permease subunit [Streptomyces sp. A7024]|uniref:ABC transporter permease subunit n=1 Tax=Streptomyces coryli TaxID=1128680 RepID=A0A6G4U606_9ACTN|nr:ABC transporter permease subunit [Streptomyces coryli]NGN67170.1 ABC transporter permease subunit [Streptomyces coryli]